LGYNARLTPGGVHKHRGEVIVKLCYLNLIAGVLALLAVPAVQAVPEQLTEEGHSADFPDLRVDRNGSRHLVWYDADVDSGAILYRMFASNGDLLIDTTQINSGGSGFSNTRPSLAVDATNRVLVVWQNNADGEIYFLRLEPYLGDLDGNAADLATIKTVDDTRISNGPAVHPRSAIDASGNLHVVREDDGRPNVQYAKVDGDGIIINGPVTLGGFGSGNDLPDIGIDSAGNVHLVFSNTGNTPVEEVYYAMIDGSTGDVLIDSTLLTPADGMRATHATLGVDPSDNKVYVVFSQVTAGGEEISMMALDPSLDNRDGSAADPAVIRLSEVPVSSGAPQVAWRAFSRFGQDRRMHVTYLDFNAAACPGGSYDIFHAHVTTLGNVLVRQTLTTTGVSSDACDPVARLAPGGSSILWAGSGIAGAAEIFSETFSRAESGSSGYTCSLGPAGSAWRAGDFWLLLAGLMALGIWRRRACR
jgi:hypothetical protein